MSDICDKVDHSQRDSIERNDMKNLVVHYQFLIPSYCYEN